MLIANITTWYEEYPVSLFLLEDYRRLFVRMSAYRNNRIRSSCISRGKKKSTVMVEDNSIDKVIFEDV
jgi:hypothetical protein